MEETAKQIALGISHTVEILASIIIGIALVKVLFGYALYLFTPYIKASKENIRIDFGRSVAVALELLLGADVLATAVAPSWDDIGQLAAIATIRTVLNYFLEKELKEMNTAPN